MIVQNEAYGAIFGVVMIELFEKQDEFPAPMAVMDLGDDMSVMEIQRCQKGDCSEPLVLMVAVDSGISARDGSQV